MTCIAGLVRDGVVYMGGDCCASDGASKSITTNKKVFIRNKMIIGYTTSFRMAQILQYSNDFPDPKERECLDIYKWLSTVFVDFLRKIYKDGGFAAKSNERESGGTIMIGAEGRLFVIQDDYSVIENACKFDAIGSGNSVALGAMFVGDNLMDSPIQIIESALSAASLFNPFVTGPFYVLSIEKNNE